METSASFEARSAPLPYPTTVKRESRFVAIPGDETRDSMLIASPRMHRGKRTKHGGFGLLELRDCEGRWLTDRLAVLLFGHRWRVLSTATRVSSSWKLSVTEPGRIRIT